MLNWLANNIATILISLGLLIIVFAIIVKLVKDKKQGKSSCGGNCGHCPMGGSCHEGGKHHG